jgi:hypothetical protein
MAFPGFAGLTVADSVRLPDTPDRRPAQPLAIAWFDLA